MHLICETFDHLEIYVLFTAERGIEAWAIKICCRTNLIEARCGVSVLPEHLHDLVECLVFVKFAWTATSGSSFHFLLNRIKRSTCLFLCDTVHKNGGRLMDSFCVSPEPKSAMGTLTWGRRKGPFGQGRLKAAEKLKLVVSLGRISALEAIDTILDKAGLLKAYGADFEGLVPPQTPLVRDALAFADEVQGMELMRHSWRTYYWGMLLGGYRGLEIDSEILFAASILHDVGLARGRTSEPGDCCFVVSGAERCTHHLVGKGHDRAKVRKVADAIGLHLNAYVSARVHGIEAHLLSRGAMCDVFGMGRRRIAASSRGRIDAEYPTGDLINELEIWPGHHLRGTRADVLILFGRQDVPSAQYTIRICRSSGRPGCNVGVFPASPFRP
ncbi:HD domain-containing protein [Roseibium salinum]|uniref:HD domain-containing protein n=1 Tax=Roseibium salinum TaxID=1604349 RepID=A0ABT3R0W5_9HYPH|nr:HD domain-containing protein [Roseibium sp. DSM 29163]MCX2722886.1 HD domain-containing protein [Roseibium sp. DSM 29163]